MAKRKITVVAAPTESGRFFAIAPFFPGARSDGDTAEEAMDGVREMVELLLAGQREEEWDALETAHKPYVTIGEVEVELPARATEPSPARNAA